jgi:hypothetical protein
VAVVVDVFACCEDMTVIIMRVSVPNGQWYTGLRC